MADPQESGSSTRREVIGATLVAGVAALVLGVLWLVSRAAPSATRDPEMRPPALVPTPTPEPTPTLVATPSLRARKRAQRRRRRLGTPEAGEAVSP